jgi:hypothetical protein
MQSMPWRRSLALIVAIVGLLGFAGAAPLAAQSMRKSVEDLTPAEVMTLRRGVATMMSRNTASRDSADFRRSWIYWANMHRHFGDDCEGPVVGNGMAGVTEWEAENASETATWCQCEHHNNNFLTWHRMFVYYFEQVLRQASGDANFTLPYWNYQTDRRLPAIFREATYVNENGQTVPNPLRVEGRRTAINNGTGQLAKSVVRSTNAMAAGTYNQFRNRLETTPHGSVHCALTGSCNTGLMGVAASAGLDPIFYLHHSNIDRLYECWLAVDEDDRLPTGSIVNRSYSFVDGAGTVVTRVVRDMLTTDQLGYGYTAAAGCPAGTLVAGGVALERGVTDVTIGVGEPEAAAPAAETARRATVHVAGVRAERAPGVMFEVYLANREGQRELIGVIDFFASGPSDGGAHAAHAGRRGRDFEFDATDAVDLLDLGRRSRFRLVFVPTTGLESSTVEQATEQMPPDARVTFRRAWLEWD